MPYSICDICSHYFGYMKLVDENFLKMVGNCSDSERSTRDPKVMLFFFISNFEIDTHAVLSYYCLCCVAVTERVFRLSSVVLLYSYRIDTIYDPSQSNLRRKTQVTVCPQEFEVSISTGVELSPKRKRKPKEETKKKDPSEHI